MTSNTNQYSYFVVYAHASGIGNTKLNQDQPMNRYEFLKSAADIIGSQLGYPVVITNFQLLSGPAEAAEDNLLDLFTRIDDAVTDADRQMTDEATDSHALAESLFDTLTQARDVLAMNLPNRTQQEV